MTQSTAVSRASSGLFCLITVLALLMGAAAAEAQMIPADDFLFAQPAPMPAVQPAARSHVAVLPIVGVAAAMLTSIGLVTFRLARRRRVVGQDHFSAHRVHAPSRGEFHTPRSRLAPAPFRAPRPFAHQN
jgi:hypothetical protein